MKMGRWGWAVVAFFGGLLVFWAITGFSNPFQKTTGAVDCKTKIKDLADKFGKANLSGKTGQDFLNYLLG